MPDTVLVAAEASPAGRNAAWQAVRLAASLGARLAAVSVEPDSGSRRLDILRGKRPTPSTPLRQALKTVGAMARTAGVQARAFLRQGRPNDVILDLAEGQDAAYIVMALRERAGATWTQQGPSATRVVVRTRRPVLMVPEHAHPEPKTVLLATDGSPCSAPAEERALALAVCYGARLRVVTAMDVPAEYHVWDNVMDDLAVTAGARLETLCRRARRLGLQAEPVVVRDDAASSILDLARDEAATLIVMGSHRRSGLRRLFQGDVAEDVLAHAPCPVLVAPLH